MAHLKYILSLLALLVLFLLNTGCSSVALTRPLPAQNDVEEQQRFEGAWIFDDQILFARFTRDNVGKFAGVDWEEDSFLLEEGEFSFTKTKDDSYLCVRIREKGSWMEQYFFARYRFSDQGDLLLWLPRVEQFTGAVQNGLLKGNILRKKHSTEVILSGTPTSILKFLQSPQADQYFEYYDPLILKKLDL